MLQDHELNLDKMFRIDTNHVGYLMVELNENICTYCGTPGCTSCTYRAECVIDTFTKDGMDQAIKVFNNLKKAGFIPVRGYYQRLMWEKTKPQLKKYIKMLQVHRGADQLRKYGRIEGSISTLKEGEYFGPPLEWQKSKEVTA